MVYLVTDTPEYFSDICEEIRLFIHQKKIDLVEALPDIFEGYGIVHTVMQTGQRYICKACLYIDSAKTAEHTEEMQEISDTSTLYYKKHTKRLAKITLYRLLSRYYKKEMPWGSLTGIRPSKLAREMITEQGDAQKASSAFQNIFDVSIEKTRKAFEIAARQQTILESVNDNDADVYIGIPFCSSRCHYCSFASNDIGKNAKYVDEYLDCLFTEIRTVIPVVPFNIRAVYIGGGTPTALDEDRLKKLLDFCREHFKNAAEFTVEAGRPDTITKEKLRIIKDYAGRISINPQTLKDETLCVIGRAHTTADFFEKFAWARAMGFDCINTDIIAGLPGETPEDVKNTIEGLAELAPENVTVHTLAIKRASRLNDNDTYRMPSQDTASEMLETCERVLAQVGYVPYYMYRQKYMMGNLENTGYTIPGKECAYNIDIMEETANILAFGAGAISKRVIAGENRIERAANVSDLMHYIARKDEMAARKIELFKR
jgi:oxygen-independent coproporphyrinogen-3 oxidase